MKTPGFVLATLCLLAGCATPPAGVVDFRQTEGASPLTAQAGWHGNKFAVATANPLASAAGYAILTAGGSAVDAAIAVQMVLTLVEPQSSGIGGGAFLMHFDGRDTEAFDGRETAPAGADENLFIKADGRPMAFHEAAVGGRAVGVPGTLRMLEMAHARHGKLPWAALFAPAIRLADDGFAISPRLHTLLKTDAYLKQDPVAAAYFYTADGQPRAVGATLRNPELAAVLRRIAAEGARALYTGELAQAVVDKVRRSANPGRLTMSDLASYRAQQRVPLCSDYRAAGARTYRLCGFPPPGSGALAIAQILGLLERTNAAARKPVDSRIDAHWMHLYTEAARLALADRAQYVADPEFVAAPGGNWATLLAPAYLAERARLIGDRRMKAIRSGTPTAEEPTAAPMLEQAEYGTSQISVIDGYGNALAMTGSIEDAFGARLMVRGFLLNNELTDFSFVRADRSGAPIANRVQPGKRPRSSMSPTLVFDKESGEVMLSSGSSGGELIIHYTAKILYAMLNWGMDPQQAINLSNFAPTLNGPILLEQHRFAPVLIEALKAHGHEVREIEMTSGVQAIGRIPGGYAGGADPRREGMVCGD